MTFDDVMRKFSGKWEDGKATIMDQGGYFWIIATGSESQYTLTRDGKRYVTTEADAKPVARRSRKTVESVNE